MSEPQVVTSLDHLGALTAEHVLGWSVCREHEHCDGCNEQVVRISGVWNCFDEVGNPVDPAVLIEDALRFFASAELDLDGRVVHDFALTYYNDGSFGPRWCEIAFLRPYAGGPDRRIRARADEWPAAICLAMLAAVGHPVTLKLEDTP